RISFVNNGWRELKETPSSNWKIPDHRAIEISVSTNHIWRERKETTRTNFGRNAKRYTATLVKSRNSKQQIHRKHFLLKNRRVFIRQISDSVEQLENSVPSSHVLRERKETIEQLKFLYLPITFGVSEKRLRGIFDEMRNGNEFK
ncbi:hypothetical protein T05_11365, partial [Trichinella murrelli]